MTKIIYRFEHVETRQGPWDDRSTWIQLCGSYDEPPVLSYYVKSDTHYWGSARLWGFTSLSQALAYFPTAHNGPDYMQFAVYEVEDRYWREDVRQAVFHKDFAWRLHTTPCRHLLVIKEAARELQLY